MEVTRFTYKYGDEERTIDMLVTGHSDLVKRLTAAPAPVGFEVTDAGMAISNAWAVDDEPTTIIHPIIRKETLGTVRRVITS